jgi:hypothetical protein
MSMRAQRALPARRERLDALAGRASNLDRVDEAVRQVPPNGVRAGLDAPAATLVDEAPDLAERPPELTTFPNLSWDTVTPTADQGAGAGEHSRRSTRSLGRLGEEVVPAFLTRRGVTIVARNVRARLGELDLVGLDGSTVVFVEVKGMRSSSSKHAEEGRLCIFHPTRDVTEIPGSIRVVECQRYPVTGHS